MTAPEAPASPNLPNPPINPSPDAQPFWDGCRAGHLVLPRCRVCIKFFFYPRSICPACGSRDLEWLTVSGRGTLHTFCVQHQSRVPGYSDVTPFVTALVDLDEGPRMMSLLVGSGTDPANIRIGTRVHVEFIDTAAGWPLPVFRAR
jgi:uncharacterized protein